MILDAMYFTGFIIGIGSFVITGICHPLVVKMEYYYGKQSWWWLVIPGLLLLVVSLFVSTIPSIILGVCAFSLFWSSVEIIKQHHRVVLGRAKKNPNRSYD
ncbi:MAG TPA: DUF4491 family protein [Bacteroidales bacterium]|nr:MAG: hypothetical protein BWY22_01817 [Bacteroidetes bacterium ADurb.Bin217]HPH16276.1 DUF4491 family protein [Bacteroidales bacterium]HPM13425.1 DUF4491 family protein [Bacteroidales bacterium]